jgi:hypothetical protein
LCFCLLIPVRIQAVARSIRVRSTNNIKGFFASRTSTDSRIARVWSAFVKPHPQERPFLGSGIEELSSDFCSDRDAGGQTNMADD